MNLLTDDGRIRGSATSSLTISNVSAADAGSYTVYVTNAAGQAQSTATLVTVSSKPIVVIPPNNQTVPPGGTATFEVKAVGTPPLFYQWQSRGIKLADNATISGATSDVLTLRNVNSVDAGTYSVIVSNAWGWATNTAAVLTVIPLTAPDIGLTTLHSFAGPEGANPISTLIQGRDGDLYGTTVNGGSSGYGTVFRITTNGALTTLHAFSDGSAGSYPNAGLLQVPDGSLYGTTYHGGQYGGGTVFRITTRGALTTLHEFSGGSDHGYPLAGLLQAFDGTLYGTTTYDGGSVFNIMTNGTFNTLWVFNGTNGADPRGGLIPSREGDLYGTTHSGGANGDGTVFKIAASGTLMTLLTFRGVSPNPSHPLAGLVQGRDGNFYGTTPPGGANERGAVFRITPAGLLTTLYSFTGRSDGQWPSAALVEGRDGYFYGTTSYGGTGFDGLESGGQGTVFRITPSGALATLAYFVGSNGAAPFSHQGALVQAADGSFYGTTFNGGTKGKGTIFRLSVQPPSLSIELRGSNIVLSWPASASDLLLQQATNLTTGEWTAVTNSPAVTNLHYQVLLAPGPSGGTFYRLTH